MPGQADTHAIKSKHAIAMSLSPRRCSATHTVAGLIGPGDRKSVQPMAARLAPGGYDQLHHFIADGVRDAAPLELELLIQADQRIAPSRALPYSTMMVPS